MRPILLPIKIFVLTAAVFFAVPGVASEGLQTLWQPIQSALQKNDVVILGEYHGSENHKTVFQAIMTPLVQRGAIDTVAVEFVQHTDNDLLQEYLNDPTAVAGSATEIQYFLKFSNCNRRCGTYANTGAWQILGSTYEILLREMRRLHQVLGSKIQFCGFNTDQFLTRQFNDVNSDVAGAKLLSTATLELGRKFFGRELYESGNDFGWGSGRVRELRFATGVVECLKGSKKALILSGGFHAMKYANVGHVLTATDLLPKMTGKRVFSGFVATATPEQMSYTKSGVFSPTFQTRYSHAKFEYKAVSSLSPQMIQDSREDQVPILSLYDFAIFGPDSKESKDRYQNPLKNLSHYPLAPYELTNISFTNQFVEFRPDLKNLRINGKTKIEFILARSGFFIFQFAGDVQSIKLNGTNISASQIAVTKPDTPLSSPIYKVNHPLHANVSHQIEIHFKVPSGSYTIFTGATGKLLSFETRFDNRYGIGAQSIFPTINLPSISPKTTVSILNSGDFKLTDVDSLCPCRATATPAGLQLDFGKVPSQQIYFELRPKLLNDFVSVFAARPNLKVQLRLSHFFLDQEYLIQNENWPLARKSLDSDFVEPMKRMIQKTIERMESLIGPYPHGAELLVSVHPEYSGNSMEYKGAVFTGAGVVVHEIIHQWFATSLRPKTNADGWLMESITTWLETRKFADLSEGLKPFYTARKAHIQNSTPYPVQWDDRAAHSELFSGKYCPSPQRPELCEGLSFEWYRIGPALFDLIDKAVKDSSNGQADLLTVLKDFFQRYAGQMVTADDLSKLLTEKHPSVDWNSYFQFTRDN